MPYAISHRSNRPVQIYYEDIGDPALPILVMQHGDGNDSQNWKSLGYVERLLPHLRLILIDTLGFGQSEKVYDPAAYSMALLASDTIAVLKHLNVTTPVHFFGGSMGGRLGYELATTPEYANFFVTFIINGMGTSRVDIVTDFSQWAAIGGMPYVVEQMEKNFLEDPFPPEVRKTFLQNDPKAYSAANVNSWLDVSEKLHLINKPTLLICGERSAEYPELKRAATLIPEAELKALPGLNHAQAYWRGDQVAPLIIDFIKSGPI